MRFFLLLKLMISDSGNLSVKEKNSALLLQNVERLFKRIDKAVSSFQKTTELSCLQGCGHCCTNPNIESTVLELMPLAEHLLKTNTDQSWYDQAKTRTEKDLCVFYKPDEHTPGKGRCQIYRYRPIVCRLYGFSGTVHKTGKHCYITCKKIKEHYTQKVADAQTQINLRLLAVPLMKTFSNQLHQIDPGLSSKRYLINDAFKQAVEIIGLFKHYTDTSKNFLNNSSSLKGGDHNGTSSTKKQKNRSKPKECKTATSS